MEAKDNELSMLDSWDKNFEARLSELDNHSDKTYWDVLVPLFKNEIKKMESNNKVLDVGCGLGFLTEEIASCVVKTTGIDTSSKSIEYAKRRFTKKGLEFENISIISYQEKHQDIRYNICIANMVFHNIPNLDENLNAISKLLGKNGHLIFSIPHPAFWYESREFEKSASYKYYEEKEYKVPFKIKGHKEHPSKIIYCHRSLQRYSELLKKNNFIITEQNEPYLDSHFPQKNKVRDILYYICRLKCKK